jgi:hypothetical protein
MKLYNVDTTAGEYSGCKDVNFHWFHSGKRSERRPYAQLIEGYEPTKKYVYYCEGYIDELFSEDEARQLKEYLDREHGDYDVTTVSEAELPVLDNVMGVGAMPVGGGDDFYMLSKKATYSLPFEVMGYFSLVGCELIDGSGGFHHRLFLLPEMRWQTDEEAAATQGNIDAGPF